MVLVLQDLELWSLRYGIWKEDDAMLKDSETVFVEKFVSSNPV